MLRFEKVTHLLAHSCPEVILFQFGVLVDGEKLNLMRLLSRLSRDHELLRGGPKDQFGTKASVTADAVMVQIGLELRTAWVEVSDVMLEESSLSQSL